MILFPPFKIRDITINPNLILSPMSGVTTSAYRQLMKEINPGSIGLVISEFISVEGLTRDSRRSAEMMRFIPEERPFGVQIFGYDIDRMREGARIAEDSGADLVDINCGCPAPKVVKRGGGCELMRQPLHLAKILREVRKAVRCPLTIKFRSGWDEQSRNAIEIARLAESEGIEALAVHGRTRSQLYRGEPDWDIVREVTEAVRIPVCGSGDIVDSQTAISRLAQSGVKGLYIGRASLRNPRVFREITGLGGPEMSDLDIMKRYRELLLPLYSARASVGRLKQLASQMCRTIPWAKQLCHAQTFEEQSLILENAVAEAVGKHVEGEAQSYL